MSGFSGDLDHQNGFPQAGMRGLNKAEAIDPNIACEFDPAQACPLKESIANRKPVTGLSKLFWQASYWLEDRGIQSATDAALSELGVPMGVETETCESGPTKGILGMGKACTAKVIYGSDEQFREQIGM